MADGWQGTIFEKVKDDYAFDKLYDNLSVLEVQGLFSKPKEEQLRLVREKLDRYGMTKFSTPTELAEIIKEGYNDILITGPNGYYGVLYDHMQLKEFKKFIAGDKR